MVQANELRIGNWINRDVSDTPSRAIFSVVSMREDSGGIIVTLSESIEDICHVWLNEGEYKGYEIQPFESKEGLFFTTFFLESKGEDINISDVLTIGDTLLIEHVKHFKENARFKGNFLMSEMSEPIPLTEEVLLKCGFTQYKNISTTYKATITTYQHSAEISILAYLYGGKVDFLRMFQGKNRNSNMLNIKALHQYQNLYYALTGKELDIEL